MQTEQSGSESTDLRAHLVALRARWWSIGIVALIVLGAALAYSFSVSPAYTAEARVQVTAVGEGTPPTRNLDTAASVAQSLSVARIVKSDLGLRADPGSLLSRLSVSVETDTAILDLRYASPDPASAKRLADGFAQAYVSFRRPHAAKQIAPAGLPSSPSSPNHLRDGILALVAGLALGVGVALLRERLDDRPRGREDHEQAVHAPILASAAYRYTEESAEGNERENGTSGALAPTPSEADRMRR